MRSNIKWVKAYVIELDAYCQRPVQNELVEELIKTGQIAHEQVSHIPFEGVLLIQNSGLRNVYYTITPKQE